MIKNLVLAVALEAVFQPQIVVTLDNGLARTPPMGRLAGVGALQVRSGLQERPSELHQRRSFSVHGQKAECRRLGRARTAG